MKASGWSGYCSTTSILGKAEPESGLAPPSSSFVGKLKRICLELIFVFAASSLEGVSL